MMNLTPHWQQIRQSYADAHVALQWVTAAIYEQSEETVPRTPIDEVDLSKALELGFLSSDDGKVGFSDPAVRHDYLVRHAVDLAIATWKELEPSSQQTYLLRLAKWKQQTAMMQEAERRSVFASILPKVRIKYGRGISYERNGEFTDPSPFAAFSYKRELPQGEFIDCLGQFHQRLQWQNVGLQDKKNGTEDEITEENDV